LSDIIKRFLVFLLFFLSSAIWATTLKETAKDSTNPEEPDKSLYSGIIYTKSVDNSDTVTKASVIHDPLNFFFYQPLTFGTQGKYNPGDFFINGGFGIWQMSPANNDRKLLDVPYNTCFQNTWNSLSHPISTIKNFGVANWFHSEIFPNSLELKHCQYFPNYFLHLIGAGMQSRKMEEWYRYNNVPLPRLCSFGTMFVEHFFEEMVEDGGTRGISEDPVSDMYIFNPAGFLLFLNDDVCNFFSKKLNLNEWSLQPSFNFRTGQLENMGQFYVVKLPLEHTHTWGLISTFGMNELFGVSRNFNGAKCLSLTGGVIINSLTDANITTSQKSYTATMRWSAGVYYDVNNSLLMSLILSGSDANRLRLNIYPGFFKIGQFSPGIFVANSNEWSTGISVRYCPIGAAVGTGKNYW
jgi:hypothetical protein